jgi:hypothetical protein
LQQEEEYSVEQDIALVIFRPRKGLPHPVPCSNKMNENATAPALRNVECLAIMFAPCRKTAVRTRGLATTTLFSGATQWHLLTGKCLPVSFVPIQKTQRYR